MRILAIDPGYDRLGIAVVEGTGNTPVLVWSDCLIPAKGAHHDRLSEVRMAVEEALAKYQPDMLAIEKLFFSVNKSSAMGVAEARGAVLAAIGRTGVPVQEFAPGTIKLAVTGNGAADKAAIAKMLPLLITLPPKKRLDDELDAIAIGITALSVGFPQ